MQPAGSWYRTKFGRTFCNCKKSFSPGRSLSGNIAKFNDNEDDNENNRSLSFFVKRVALGIAIALWPDDSKLQQSLAPSAMKSVSPGRKRFNTGRL